jgi:hypothetical protein
MLAWTGFVLADLCPLPGVTLSSVAAHDANLGAYGGAMGQIFWWIGLVEILGSIPAINYTMNGGDREPGDYALDPLGFLEGATPAQKEEWLSGRGSGQEPMPACDAAAPSEGVLPPLFTLETCFPRPNEVIISHAAALDVRAVCASAGVCNRMRYTRTGKTRA